MHPHRCPGTRVSGWWSSLMSSSWVHPKQILSSGQRDPREEIQIPTMSFQSIFRKQNRHLKNGCTKNFILKSKFSWEPRRRAGQRVRSLFRLHLSEFQSKGNIEANFQRWVVTTGSLSKNSFVSFFFFFILWPCLVAWILVSWPGIKLMPLVLEDGFLTTGPPVKWNSLRRVQLFAILWTIQSLDFSRPEYWSR